MRVTIIADASHCPTTLAGGYGYWIASERGKLGGGGELRGLIDNNIAAEMYAIVNALYIAIRSELVQTGDAVLLQTDCMAAIDRFQRKTLRFIHQERCALEEVEKLKADYKLELTFRHVKGHTRKTEARYVTNNLCDERAKIGMRSARIRIRNERNQHGESTPSAVSAAEELHDD